MFGYLSLMSHSRLRSAFSGPLAELGTLVSDPVAEPEQQCCRRIGVYPGSFDPITNGHIDLIRRAAKLVDRLIIAVLRNEAKQPVFSMDERIAMIGESLQGDPANVEIDGFDGLLAAYAVSQRAGLIVRGIRALGDYESESRMALMNRRLAPEVETVFLLASEQFSYVSSALVKEVARFGGNISGLVPLAVEGRLRDRVLNSRNGTQDGGKL